LPTLVQVTWVAALMVSEKGLKEPPPPAIVTLVAAAGMQAGCGFGLGEGLVPGDGLALGEGLALGDGLGLIPCAKARVEPTLKKRRVRRMASACIQDWVDGSLRPTVRMVVIFFFRLFVPGRI
jgi:hypothetical protein